MRARLSAVYSSWIKGGLAFFVCLFVYILSSGVRRALFDSFGERVEGWLFFLFAIVLFWGCYQLIAFVLKDRKIVEFDDTYLYIEDKKTATETQVPLENVFWLNMRMRELKMGTVWFFFYSLHYRDESRMERKVKFFIRTGSDEFAKFLTLVKAKNPDFRFKNWSWSFDFKD
jgi:hypothetical protein